MRIGKTNSQMLVTALLLSVLGGMGLANTAFAPTSAPPPQPAPDFMLTQCANADTIKLSDFTRQPVLLFFYDGGDMASWNALPYVREWHRRYEGDDLKIIGIHSPGFEPLKNRVNAVEVISLAKITFPVGMDSDRSIYQTYSLKTLPAYVLLRPGGQIVFETSSPRTYVEVEKAIQKLLMEGKRDIINPFIVKPLRPLDDPDKKILRASPMVVLGYQAGVIAGCDSPAYDEFHNYFDSREREKGRVYLQGYWKVGPRSISHELKYGSSEDHLRIIYTAKDVWLLPDFPYSSPQRVYVKQDREYLRDADWGKGIQADLVGKPYISTLYSIPVHIVSNRAFGTHELELIPTGGDVAFCYLFFEGDVAD